MIIILLKLYFLIHFYFSCILDYLHSKCVILVTNQLQYLSKSSKIVCLQRGRSLLSDSLQNLINSGIDFKSILGEHIESEENEIIDKNCDLNVLNEEQKHLKHKNTEFNTEFNYIKQFQTEDQNDKSGEIDFKIYFNYFKSNSGWGFIGFALMSAFLTQFIFHLTDYWLSFW